ncbi:MAG: thioredoxin family protein [Melioribacteraceae bacterium]|nr:thioredoxin family protein [Melioribacteraceae bacterium]MCF8357034.1 thioredoxin family protein [Melioribacteraceae bacterium]MCF8393950.1 thioredoxin family protein [Melioribacteraceae bacterium]MCF8419023.1 thioredoxin family protein [Melioribacteraceae bacterium]
MKQIKEVSSIEEFNKIRNLYDEIIVFKYSTESTVSFVMEKLFDNWFQSLTEADNIFAVKVNVIKSKELSRKLTDDHNIKHESPQVVWFDKDNNVRWTAHHHMIKQNELNRIILSIE